MMNKFLFLDDDEMTNFITKILFEEADFNYDLSFQLV